MRNYFIVGTLISTDHHDQYKIESFESQQGLQTFDVETGEYYNGFVSSIDYKKLENVIKIEHEDGQIIVSERQQFRVGSEWVEAKDLKVGDKLKKMEEDSTIKRVSITKIDLIQELTEMYGFIDVKEHRVFFANKIMVLDSQMN